MTENAYYLVVQVNSDGSANASSAMTREAAYSSITHAFGVRCLVCRIEAVMEAVPPECEREQNTTTRKE
jgi:hypothetical protein